MTKFVSCASRTIDDVDANDIGTQTTVLEAQLTNLFQIADANDKVLECIETIEGLPSASDPSPNSDLSSNVEKVPAMCGAEEPPVEEVQNTAADITKTCGSLTEQPTAAELNALLFIKVSLITFKQTFVSQISIFSQKLTSITGITITAASLKVEVISSSGAIETATEVDISGGNEEGSQSFLIYRIEILQSSLNAIIKVLSKVTEIMALSSGSMEVDLSSFALQISTFSASLSSGAVTASIIETAQKILQTEITVLPSKAILILLTSVQSSLESLQISILSAISTNFRLLIQLEVSLSTISFTISDFDASGAIITTTVSASSISDNLSSSELTSSLGTFVEIQTQLSSVKDLVEAAIEFDFSSISTATTEVSASVFVSKLSSFLIVIGQNMADTNIVSLSTSLLELKISTAFSQTIKSKIQFIISLCQSYLIQITVQTITIQQQLSTGVTSLSLSLDILIGLQTQYSQIITTIETASTSTSITATTSAAAFFELCQEFIILISSISLENLATQYTLITTLGTKIIEAGSAGVTISSARFKFIYVVIINNLKILQKIVEVQISLITPDPSIGGTTSAQGAALGTSDQGTESPTIDVMSSSVSKEIEYLPTKPILTDATSTMIMTTHRPTLITTRPLPTGFFTGLMTTRDGRARWRGPNLFFRDNFWSRSRGIQ